VNAWRLRTSVCRGNGSTVGKCRARRAEDEHARLGPRTQQVIATDPRERSAALAVFLASDVSGTLSGRVLSHANDFNTLASRIQSIMASDAYTLRRVEEA
jgi:hypothetical protein